MYNCHANHILLKFKIMYGNHPYLIILTQFVCMYLMIAYYCINFSIKIIVTKIVYI